MKKPLPGFILLWLFPGFSRGLARRREGSAEDADQVEEGRDNDQDADELGGAEDIRDYELALDVAPVNFQEEAEQGVRVNQVKVGNAGRWSRV